MTGAAQEGAERAGETLTGSVLVERAARAGGQNALAKLGVEIVNHAATRSDPAYRAALDWVLNTILVKVRP